MARTKATPAPHRGGIPLPFDCKPFRGPKLTEDGKPFEPKAYAPGDEITVTGIAGEPVVAQVWGPGSGAATVWAVCDDVAYLVSKKHGLVLESKDYRHRVATADAA